MDARLEEYFGTSPVQASLPAVSRRSSSCKFQPFVSAVQDYRPHKSQIKRPWNDVYQNGLTKQRQDAMRPASYAPSSNRNITKKEGKDVKLNKVVRDEVREKA